MATFDAEQQSRHDADRPDWSMLTREDGEPCRSCGQPNIACGGHSDTAGELVAALQESARRARVASGWSAREWAKRETVERYGGSS